MERPDFDHLHRCTVWQKDTWEKAWEFVNREFAPEHIEQAWEIIFALQGVGPMRVARSLLTVYQMKE